jgi:hypothetical protein
MTDVIWAGPVSAQQRQGATIEGAQEHFISCLGSECRARPDAWRDADGRCLPGMLREFGITEGSEVFAGAFSAGGQLWKQVLANADDRAAIRALALADGAYELAGDDGRPAPSPSLVDYAAEAATGGERFFLATASSTPNNVAGVAQPSGSDTLARIASDLEDRIGPLVQQSWIPGAGLEDLHPARVWLAGRDPHRPNVILCDFGATYAHAQHATVLAPRLWPALLQPWIDARAATSADADAARSGADTTAAGGAETGGPVAASPDGGVFKLVLGVGVAALVALAVRSRGRRG